MSIHADGAVDIQFDDGDFEQQITNDRLSATHLAPPVYIAFDSDGFKLRRGVRVKAPWQSGSKFYPGVYFADLIYLSFSSCLR